MSDGAEWGPGKRISIKVCALGRFMHLIRPLAAFDCGLAVCVRADMRHRCSVRVQVLQEAMLFQQSLSIAHAPTMPLDEYSSAGCCNHAGRGKWPRARAQNF